MNAGPLARVVESAIRPSAHQLIEMTLDPGSFISWDEPSSALDVETSYTEELVAATLKTGLDESVVTGVGELFGRRVAVIVGEFGFLGGSIGVRAAERICDALRRATSERLPVLAAPVSGGTRMQEGTVAFLQMVKITQNVLAHKASGLPYLVYLRHPTTGGVYASWGSLGHITVAETGALIGFLGPKVYEALYGVEFPAGVQTAENLYAHGLVDAVLDPARLRSVARQALEIIGSRAATATPRPAPYFVIDETDAWTSIEISRRSGRPGVRSLLRYASDETLPLSGTGQGENAKSSVIALARIGGHGVVVVGMDRRVQEDAPLGPEALRQARRGMTLAAELGLPLVTIVDTPGAALSKEAEEGGLAGEIARCLAQMLDLPVPTISVIMGQGTGGGALALAAADRTLIARHGWLAPLPPEGASMIRFGDTAHAEVMATQQRVRASELLADGIVDEVIDERPTADAEPAEFCRRIGEALARQLSDLQLASSALRMGSRIERYARIGRQ
jgi:acyl-CoA carboxylase subunit beta